MARKPAASSRPTSPWWCPSSTRRAPRPALAREIAAAFKGRNYEMVFVDDASRDGTARR